ncbi:hypothetical protein B0H16DRAFT_1861576 [Mycena metata]|uniref:Uncharacterized protein n=1 Tax=Mycena metata TaxID=1033252 RepID=A0AAD7N2P9_9AGAR|nr:hypothetical protein B0H16DRAFT_1861576 [Mycena metata]
MIHPFTIPVPNFPSALSPLTKALPDFSTPRALVGCPRSLVRTLLGIISSRDIQSPRLFILPPPVPRSHRSQTLPIHLSNRHPAAIAIPQLLSSATHSLSRRRFNSPPQRDIRPGSFALGPTYLGRHPFSPAARLHLGQAMVGPYCSSTPPSNTLPNPPLPPSSCTARHASNLLSPHSPSAQTGKFKFNTTSLFLPWYRSRPHLASGGYQPRSPPRRLERHERTSITNHQFRELAVWRLPSDAVKRQKGSDVIKLGSGFSRPSYNSRRSSPANTGVNDLHCSGITVFTNMPNSCWSKTNVVCCAVHPTASIDAGRLKREQKCLKLTAFNLTWHRGDWVPGRRSFSEPTTAAELSTSADGVPGNLNVKINLHRPAAGRPHRKIDYTRLPPPTKRYPTSQPDNIQNAVPLGMALRTKECHVHGDCIRAAQRGGWLQAASPPLLRYQRHDGHHGVECLLSNDVSITLNGAAIAAADYQAKRSSEILPTLASDPTRLRPAPKRCTKHLQVVISTHFGTLFELMFCNHAASAIAGPQDRVRLNSASYQAELHAATESPSLRISPSRTTFGIPLTFVAASGAGNQNGSIHNLKEAEMRPQTRFRRRVQRSNQDSTQEEEAIGGHIRKIPSCRIDRQRPP